MSRHAKSKYLSPDARHFPFGLDRSIIAHALSYVHQTVDDIDSKLIEGGGDRLGGLVELANLSAIIGNLFRNGVVRASEGRFAANGPHKYPDLLGAKRGCADIEIKVALEKNKPKGHLIKPGPHILVRYVMVDESGNYTPGVRGQVPLIWEVRIGMLQNGHFNVSNTEGDSGKTAGINAAGMAACQMVYCDLDAAAMSARALARLQLQTSLFSP
jgi:hypothetical protein